MVLVKRLSLVLASITLAIACSFFLSGKLIQKSYYEKIAELNTRPNMKVNMLSYDRGFLHSTVKLSVEIGTDNPSDMQVFTLKQIITHGPVIAANTADGHRIKFLAGQIVTSFDDPWDKKLQEYTSNKNPLTVTTLVDFSSEATTWFHLEAVEQNTPTNFHLAIGSVDGRIEHDLDFAYYHGYITLPQLQVDNPSWEFKLKNIVVSLDANSKEAVYSSSNTMTTETLTYHKNNEEVIKLDGISAKLAFFNKDNNLGVDLEASIADSRIMDHHFKDDTIKLQADHLNRATLGHLPRITTLGAKSMVDLLQDLTVASNNVTLELPKDFTEAIISYISYEVYRSSYLGSLDPRPANAVFFDITGSINKLVQGALQQELFVDKGTHYALNFNRPARNRG